LFFNAVWSLTSGGFRIVSDILVIYRLVIGPTLEISKSRMFRLWNS